VSDTYKPWDCLLTGLFIQAYITGNAFSILGDPDTLLQTVYDDDGEPLQAIALDEASGKIAVCTHRAVRIYKPFGREEDALRVRAAPKRGALAGSWR
jgi:hypothetical protein